jgi:hypothetical protein
MSGEPVMSTARVRREQPAGERAVSAAGNSIETLPSYRRSTLYMAVGPLLIPAGWLRRAGRYVQIHRSTSLRRSS